MQGAFSPADASDPRVVSVAQFAITAINKQLPAAQQFTLTTGSSRDAARACARAAARACAVVTHALRVHCVRAQLSARG